MTSHHTSSISLLLLFGAGVVVAWVGLSAAPAWAQDDLSSGNLSTDAPEEDADEPLDEDPTTEEPPSTGPRVTPEPAAPAFDEDDAPDGSTPPEVGEDVVETLGGAIGELGDRLGRPTEPHGRVRWDPTWPRYRFDELVVTVGMGLVIGLEELLPTRSDPNWSGVTDFDLEAAAAFGLHDPTARRIADDVSNGIVAALFLYPLLVDAVLFAGVGEGAWDVAWQLSLIGLEVFTVNHALTVLVRLLGRRERPLGRFCREETGYDADPVCRDQPPAESFWSSQVSNAFAGAALVCMYHDAVDLFGDEVADGMACGSALGAAAAVGVLRMMADQNWVTDVMTAALVGSLSGTLIPYLLHFMGGARPPLRGSDAPTITFAPMGGPDTMGISARGTF